MPTEQVKGPRLALGVDPDTRGTGFAIVQLHEGKFTPILMGVIETQDPGARGIDAVLAQIRQPLPHQLLGVLAHCGWAAIEFQQNYRNGKARPDDLSLLSAISGAWASIPPPMCEVMMPKPAQWKGTVPKGIHQKRTISKLDGWDFEDRGAKDAPLPLPPDGLSISGIQEHHWKEIVDAIGLAIWALERAEVTDAVAAL